MNVLTHLSDGGEARMVDVASKPFTTRCAVAQGAIRMRPETLTCVLEGDIKKGDVRSVATLTGIMGAKRVSDLIPLCHQISLSSVDVRVEADPSLPGFQIRAEARTFGQTGVEMEALTAVSLACLAIYDMAKALDREMVIESIALIQKSGGTSGDFYRTQL